MRSVASGAQNSRKTTPSTPNFSGWLHRTQRICSDEEDPVRARIPSGAQRTEDLAARQGKCTPQRLAGLADSPTVRPGVAEDKDPHYRRHPSIVTSTAYRPVSRDLSVCCVGCCQLENLGPIQPSSLQCVQETRPNRPHRTTRSPAHDTRCNETTLRKGDAAERSATRTSGASPGRQPGRPRLQRGRRGRRGSRPDHRSRSRGGPA